MDVVVLCVACESFTMRTVELRSHSTNFNDLHFEDVMMDLFGSRTGVNVTTSAKVAPRDSLISSSVV